MQYIATRNGRTISLTADDLTAVSSANLQNARPSIFQVLRNSTKHLSLYVSPDSPTGRFISPSNAFLTQVARNASFLYPKASGQHHFDYSDLGVCSESSSFLTYRIDTIFISIIGLAYPLYNGFLPLYLADRLDSGNGSLNETYRDYTIVSVMGIPGSIIACVLVDWTRQAGTFSIGGRKLALAVSTVLTGLFLFLFTTSKTNAAYLGYSCASSLTQNAVSLIIHQIE